MSNFNPDDFKVLYPGAYTEKEKALVEKYITGNRAIEERGQIDVQALIKGKLPKNAPGIGPSFTVTEAMVRYNNEKYDPDNPVLNDAEYAKKHGYRDIIAMPCFGAHDDSYMSPFPRETRDTLCVSQLNHSITNYKPVYPGDILYLVVNSRSFTDRTPAEGSVYRSIVLRSAGSVYNQNGEKVNDVVFSVMESLKTYKENKKPAKMGFFDMWEAPDWKSRRPHYYTDKDWEFIKNTWSSEKPRGNKPLYWEDVKIGDEPAWTADGPILDTPSPAEPYGMGVGGSRTMKKEIMNPDVFKTMVRDDKFGIYRLPDKEDYIPAIPDGVAAENLEGDEVAAQKDPDETRSVLINFQGRDIAIRHINNWMGDYGWIYNIRWGIMPCEAHAALGKEIPKNPDVGYFLGKIPAQRGKFALAHGLTGDLALVKSYVYDKYARDNQFFAELGWWIETIEGDIWLEGGATVRLPSKRA